SAVVARRILFVIELVVSGAGGRLGKRIVALASRAEGLRVAAGLVRAGSAGGGGGLGGLCGGGAPPGLAAPSPAGAARSPAPAAACWWCARRNVRRWSKRRWQRSAVLRS